MPDDTRGRASWPSALQAFAAASIPLAIALVGHLYTRALREREVQARFVELALTILQAPPDSATRNLRSWAIRVVNRFSSVPLDSSVASDLRQVVPLPTAQSTPEPLGSSGLTPGTPVYVRLQIPFRATVRWARLHTPGVKVTLDRQLGPGLDSFPLPFGSTVFLTAVRAGSGDSSITKADCSKGCTVEIP